MAIHQNDPNANQLWLYFQKVIQWVEAVFTNKRSEMKGIEWGLLYNQFKDVLCDTAKLEDEIRTLMIDDEGHEEEGGVHLRPHPRREALVATSVHGVTAA
jgi:hypothetical protein